MELMIEEVKEFKKRLLEIKIERQMIKDDIENFEVDSDNYEYEFEEYLEKKYGDIVIEGCTFSAVDILKEMDSFGYDDELEKFAKKQGPESDDEYADLKVQLTELDEEELDIRVELEDLDYKITAIIHEMEYEQGSNRLF